MININQKKKSKLQITEIKESKRRFQTDIKHKKEEKEKEEEKKEQEPIKEEKKRKKNL